MKFSAKVLVALAMLSLSCVTLAVESSDGGIGGQGVHVWTSAEVAAPDSIEGQLRAQGMFWTQAPGEIGVGAYVQDMLEGRLDQPVGRGAIGKVESVCTAENGESVMTVDFGRDYSVAIFLSELCPVVIHPAPGAAHPRTRVAAARPAYVAQKSLDIDFGVWKTELSEQTGGAAAGSEGDFWNAVSVPWSDNHTESGLKFTDGSLAPVQVTLINLGGSWSSAGHMGVKSFMLDHYNYPKNNQGGNSKVILKQVPAGTYWLYLYGHGPDHLYYGDYALTVGTRDYGRKTTLTNDDLTQQKEWVEGDQYVKFAGVKVEPGDSIEILIQPGGEVTEPCGRRFSDAIICGLQLIPAERDGRPVSVAPPPPQGL